MDDGCLVRPRHGRSYARFATNGFLRGDVERLGRRLNDMYGVSWHLVADRGYTLNVTAGLPSRGNDIRRLWEAIAPHVAPVMRYKLPEDYHGVPYKPYPTGTEHLNRAEATVEGVAELDDDERATSSWSRTAYDITTTTHNFFAKNTLVHNCIVVQYGARRDLVLLAAFHRDGNEVPLVEAAPHWDGIGSVVRTWPPLSLVELIERTGGNQRLDGGIATGADAEGYVLRFASGLRVKAKFAEYARLHKILTGIKARDVWRYLGAQKFGFMPPKTLGQALGCSAEEAKQLAGIYSGALSTLLENVPDEFDAWIRGVVADLEAAAEALKVRIEAEFATMSHLRGDRAAFARAAQSVEDGTVRAAMFLMLDGKAIDLHVWRAIRPEPSDPFKADEEG